jgi:Uncharacterized protein conserved in bacteria (DUF2272)
MLLCDRLLDAALLAALGGCVAPDAHVPPFARTPYEPFSRADAIAVATDEWHLFGSPVDDSIPGSSPSLLPSQRPGRWPGLWERIGEYWWLGQDAGTYFSRWTGKHDAKGRIFPASESIDYAWSAAFISYVMREAGAGPKFPYSAAHAFYVDAGWHADREANPRYAVRAERVEDYAPETGDLICFGTGRDSTLRFHDLPVPFFYGHCDLVTGVAPGMLTVIGGNVDDAVTMKHVPTTREGRLATQAGHVVDPRYPWFVVVRVLYDR